MANPTIARKNTRGIDVMIDMPSLTATISPTIMARFTTTIINAIPIELFVMVFTNQLNQSLSGLMAQDPRNSKDTEQHWNTKQHNPAEGTKAGAGYRGSKAAAVKIGSSGYNSGHNAAHLVSSDLATSPRDLPLSVK